MLSYFHTPARMLKRRFSSQPITRYWGEPEHVCRQIIAACFNQEHNYYMVSAGHFKEFYSRDFGMCTEALLALDYTKEVILTLGYALSRFHHYNKITTTINDEGYPVDFFRPAADSLPFLLRSIRLVRDHVRGNDKVVFDKLLFKYKKFLEHQAEVYVSEVFDFQTGLVKEFKKFSSIKDHEYRSSSTYDNAMAGMLSIELDLLGWNNPLHDIPLGKHLLADRWNGSFFKEDATNSTLFAAQANVFPFYAGLYSSKELLKRTITSIQQAGLDSPFPLKYTNTNRWGRKHLLALLAPGYEGATIWAHLGFCYLYVVEKHDPAMVKDYVQKYHWNIKEFGNFLEVYAPDGKSPYKGPFYISDESMLWASMYLHLAKKYGIK